MRTKTVVVLFTWLALAAMALQGALAIPVFRVEERAFPAELTIADHKLIVSAVMEYADQIMNELPQRVRITGITVLEAALRVPGIDSYTKSRIRLVLEHARQIESGSSHITDELRLATEDILAAIDECGSPQQMAEVLEEMEERYSQYPELTAGIRVAIGIVEDGAASIYAPLATRGLGFSWKRLVREDVEGAITGAITGGWLGALVGAVVSSALDLFCQVTGWC